MERDVGREQSRAVKGHGPLHPRFHVKLVRRAIDDPLPSQIVDDAQPGLLLLDNLGDGDGDGDSEEEYAVEKILRVERARRGKGW